MTKLVHSSEFFVVGGPVQPDRPCYIARNCDQDLIRALVDQRFAYVLSARGTGKTSLMGATIRYLRDEEELAAGIDLTQIASRGQGVDSSRWFYNVAHRIVRELRLKVELQSWWQDRSALASEQVFADFFWEIVLNNTDKPVSIFFDEIERTLDLPFSSEFFSVIRDCYALRVSEPEYSRLNFVVLGVATPASLCPEPAISPFADGDAIEPGGFAREQCYALAPGFNVEKERAEELLERIYAWTQGHPYLTQKIARAVARRGGELEHVERVVHELFLSQGLVREEPLLSSLRDTLSTRRRNARQVLSLLGRVASDARVPADAGSAAQDDLRMSGVVRVNKDRALVFSNPIFAEVFTQKWAKSAMPFNWRGIVAAAAVLAALVVTPIWYFNHLPAPFLQVLTSTDPEYAAAEDAYTKLHRLPGFRSRAEELFAEILSRRSREAQTLESALETDAVIRELDDADALADTLMSEFWMRRADSALNAENRDAAILYAVSAAEGAPDRALPLLAQLAGDGYARLGKSFRLGGEPLAWAADWERQSLTVIDDAHHPELFPIGESPSQQQDNAAAIDRVTALQHVPLIRELSVDDDGSASSFELRVDVDHERPRDVMLTLTAPSGATAGLRLSDADRSNGVYIVPARSGRPLASLADERRQGVWRLTLDDGRRGATGTLRSWTLQFPGSDSDWRDSPVQGIPVPDPGRTEQVDVTLSRDGRFAIARPSRPGAIGALAVWDLTTGQLRADLQLDRVPDAVRFASEGDTLLVIASDSLSIWNIDAGRVTSRIQTQTQFLLAPSASPEGSYVAIAEEVEGSAPLYSLVRTSDGELVSSVTGVADVQSWVLGPEARYLALLSNALTIDIMDPRRGGVVASLELAHLPQRLVPIPGDDLLLTVDEAGDITAWRFIVTPDGLETVDSWWLGKTRDVDSISVAADASSVAFATASGHVAVHDLRREQDVVLLRMERPDSSIETRLSPQGQQLVTSNESQIRVWDLAQRGRAVARDRELSAMAIGEQGRIAALGFRGGYVRAPSIGTLTQTPAQTETDTSTAPAIGHTGPVSVIDVSTGTNQIATGGDDGVVRIWNLSSVMPGDELMRHAVGPVLAVALSPDGRWIASAAEYSARIWRVQDSELATELFVNGAAGALAFSADSGQVAVGDSAGNVFTALLTEEDFGMQRSLRADAAIGSLAFAPDGNTLATGDVQGKITLWDMTDVPSAGRSLDLTHPLRWLAFDESGRRLLVQTDRWAHIVDVEQVALSIVESHFLPPDLAAGAAWIDGAGAEPDRGGIDVRLIGGLDTGRPLLSEFAFAGETAEPSPEAAALLERDWGQILGLTLSAEGFAVAVSDL